jgi:hypothetical protein
VIDDRRIVKTSRVGTFTAAVDARAVRFEFLDSVHDDVPVVQLDVSLGGARRSVRLDVNGFRQ